MSPPRFDWKYDAQASSKNLAPDTGRDNEPLARHLAGCGLYRGHTTAGDPETVDWDLFEDPRTEVPSAFRHAVDKYVRAQMSVV
jgi:hypothetical protein